MNDLNLDLSALANATTAQPDLVCLSHLRWDFVYQRPQHLLSRCARERRVFFFEEPIFDGPAHMEMSQRDNGVWVVVPHLPEGMGTVAVEASLRKLLDDMLVDQNINDYILWYYTPMSLGFSRHLKPSLTIYDCMDELSMFKGASPILREREFDLFRRANLIFTGGQSLYEAKRHQHANVYAFPSSIDVPHFAQARDVVEEPADQAGIPHPRLGFFGVIDERMDIELVAQLAEARPDWHLVLIGPVVKIDPESLPQQPNIHYLGGKSYKDLPKYLAGWDVALLPFAQNDSTRFISPTKTPEYLAGGKPVVSAPIRDVIRPYGDQNMVWIAGSAPEFESAVEAALQLSGAPEQKAEWLSRVDAFLSQMSWDRTWTAMKQLIELETAIVARRVEQAAIAVHNTESTQNTERQPARHAPTPAPVAQPVFAQSAVLGHK